MNKKLLAAAFAAAFLVTSGLAKAGEDYYQSASDQWRYHDGTSDGTWAGGDISVGTGDSVGLWTAVRGTGTGGSITITDGDLFVGSKQNGTIAFPVIKDDISINSLTMSGGALNIDGTYGSLVITDDSSFTGGTVTNDGTIENFISTMVFDSGVTYLGTGLLNNAGGAIEIAGDNATMGNIFDSLARDTDTDIGDIEITGTVTDTDIAPGSESPGNITAGTVMVSATIDDSIGSNINVGGADLELAGDNNESWGSIDAGAIAISGDAGDYHGVITGKNGVGIFGQNNNFDNEIIADEGDIVVDEDATGTDLSDVTARAGDVIFESAVNTKAGTTVAAHADITDPDAPVGGNVNIQNGGTFNGTITADLDIDVDNGGTFNDTVQAGRDITTTDATYTASVDATNNLVSDGDTFMTNGGTVNVGSNAELTDSTLIDTEFIAGDNIQILGGVTADKSSWLLSESIDISGDDNILLGGASTTKGLTLLSGSSATLGGTYDTGIVVESGSTLTVGGENLVLGTTEGNITTEAGSVIKFAALDDPSTGTQTLAQIVGNGNTQDATYFIDLDSSTKLVMDLDAVRDLDGEEQQVFDADARNLITMSDSELASYLNSQAVVTLSDSGSYTVDDNGIYYTHDNIVNPFSGLKSVLANQGIARYEGMISDNTLMTQYYYSSLTEDELDALNLNKQDRYLADLFRLGAGHTMENGYSLTDRPNEAYALEQWKNGADWAGAVEAVTDTVRGFNRAITSRAYNLGSLLGAVAYDDCGNPIDFCGGYKNRIWAGYTGMWGKNSGRSWDKGYKYDAHGFNVGYDHVTSSGVGFGAAFGYSRGDYKNYGSIFSDKSKIHNYSFGLFASYNHSSGFFSVLSGTYTYSKYKMNNMFSVYDPGNIGSYDHANFHGDTWSFGGKVGYDFQPVQNLTITPTLGLYYYSTRTNRFNTTYRNGMKYSNHTVEMPLDVTVKYDIQTGADSTLSLVATGGYAYNFHNKGTKISGFTMGGSDLEGDFGDYRFVKPGRSSWNIGAGVQYRIRNIDLGLNYEYYGRKDYKSHSLNANVGYSF